MPLYRLQQNFNLSCGAASSAVAAAELGGGAPPNNADEDAIYRQVSRNYPNDVSAPARIVRYFKDRPGFRASLVESPYRSTVLLVAQREVLLPEWWAYTTELWQWRNWIWRWPRGIRERDFDHDARVLMVCATPDGLHYLLARRDNGDYYVMDPAFNTNTRVARDRFAGWAGFDWADGRAWNPGIALNTGRDNYYLGIAVWVNTDDAPYVFY